MIIQLSELGKTKHPAWIGREIKQVQFKYPIRRDVIRVKVEGVQRVETVKAAHFDAFKLQPLNVTQCKYCNNHIHISIDFEGTGKHKRHYVICEGCETETELFKNIEDAKHDWNTRVNK